jgi:hypothetical protein
MIDIIGKLQTLLTRLSAVRAGYLDNLSAGAAALEATSAKKGSSMDFWSESMETFTIPAADADTAITPTVVVAGLPAGCTILRVVAMFKYRKVSAVADSAINGAQEFQVDDVANTGWLDCIKLADNQFTLKAGDIEGGDVLIGSIDIKARVDADDTYDFQLDEGHADTALVFTGVQVGLRVWYR